TFRRSDQKAEHQGRHGPDEAHAKFDDILGLAAQMLRRKHGAQNHPQERTSKDAREYDAANRQGTHEILLQDAEGQPLAGLPVSPDAATSAPNPSRGASS